MFWVAAALIGGMAHSAHQEHKQNKQMREIHQNAERMYAAQQLQIKNEQAKMAAEKAIQQERLNKGAARSNRARHGAVFGDETSGKLGG